MRIRTTYKKMADLSKAHAPGIVFSDYTEVEESPKADSWEDTIVEYDRFSDVAFEGVIVIKVENWHSRPIENALYSDLVVEFAKAQKARGDFHHICYEGWQVIDHVGGVRVVSLYSGS